MVSQYVILSLVKFDKYFDYLRPEYSATKRSFAKVIANTRCEPFMYFPVIFD